MVNAVYDHVMAILVVGAVFVGAVIILPTMSSINIKAVDEQQLRNTALNVFNTMLLDTGYPLYWGSIRDFKKNDPRVQRFGLASAEDSTLYVLDPDKVQRLVVGNPLNYCDYNRVKDMLGLNEYGFRLRIVPPFNVTFLKHERIGNTLYYQAKVYYLDGGPIPNAMVSAIVICAGQKGSGELYFNITQFPSINTNEMGICNCTVNLAAPSDITINYDVVILRVTVADVATLVISSQQPINNTIARINIVYDEIILTSWKDPPDYNDVKQQENVWILHIATLDSKGSIWNWMDKDKPKGSNDPMFNSGKGPFERWSSKFTGLHDSEPVIVIFDFWADDGTGKGGRRQIIITTPYPQLLGTNIFEFGPIPKSGCATARVQRSVMISGMTYTSELTLWKESP
jgi:hypothetical protein